MPRSSGSLWSQLLQNRLVLIVMAMVVIVPFIATPAEGESLGMAGVGVDFMAGLLLVVLLWRAKWSPDRESVLGFLKTGANLPVLLYFGFAAFSAVFAPQKMYALQELTRIGSGIVLYFVAAYHFRRSEQLTRLVDVLLYVAVGAAFIGFIQYGAGGAEQQFATGPFGDHQLFGSFMMILLPMVAVVAITERAPNRQLLAQVATVVTLMALLLSHARSAWLGGAMGIGALGMLSLYIASKRTHLHTRKHEFVLPIMLLGVSVVFFLMIAPQTSSFVDRAGTLANVQTEKGWQYRQVMMRGAEKMIQERPGMGFGLGSYPYLQNKYTGYGLPLSGITGRTRPSLGEQAHNTYLQTAAELGLPGLLLFVGVLAAFLGFGLQKVGTLDAGIRRTVLLGALGSIIAFTIDALGSPAWQFGQISMFFWLILGMGVGCLRPRIKQQATSEEPAPVFKPSRAMRTMAVVMGIGIMAILPAIAATDPDPSYLTPVPGSGQITPVNAHDTVRNGQVAYSLSVLFNDSRNGSQVRIDVTTAPDSSGFNESTNFTQSGSSGTMTGTNNHIYQRAGSENALATITGTYTQTDASGTQVVSASTQLCVGTGPSGGCGF